MVVVNNGINYDKGVQITGKPGDFPETLASISRDTNTIVISVSDIPNQYLTFQDDKTTERGRKRFPKLGIIYGSAGAT